MKEVSSNIYATGQATHRNWQPMPGAHAVGRADPARRGSQCDSTGRRTRARTDGHAEAGWDRGALVMALNSPPAERRPDASIRRGALVMALN